jgi:hypothetical protein
MKTCIITTEEFNHYGFKTLPSTSIEQEALGTHARTYIQGYEAMNVVAANSVEGWIEFVTYGYPTKGVTEAEAEYEPTWIRMSAGIDLITIIEVDDRGNAVMIPS